MSINGGIELFHLSETTDERRAGRLFFAMNVILFTCFATFIPYLSAYYVSHGIESSQIGVLLSIGSVTTIFILPIWSRISDQTGNRRAVLKIVILGASLSVLLFIVSKNFWALFFTAFLFMSFYMSVVPLFDAVVISYLSKTRIKYSSIRLGGSIGFGLMILLSGFIFAYNTTLTFILASVLFFVLFLCTWKVPQVKIEKKQKRKLDYSRIVRNKRLVFILFIAFAIQIVSGFFYGFIGVYILELGFTSREIGIANFVSVIFEIPVYFVIDRVLKRFSVTSVAIFCGFVVVIRMMLLFIATGTGIVYLSMAGAGVGYITLYYSCATFINNEMEDDLKSTGQSLLAFFQMGLGSITGSIAGGYISMYIGTRNVFMVFGAGLGIVCFICTLVFSALKIRRKLFS